MSNPLTASGGVVFDDVHVRFPDVLGVLPVDEDESSPRWPRLSLSPLAGVDARGLAMTMAERGRTALAISAAKVVCTRVATEVTSRIFELTGARLTVRAVGLDRFWRDARTLTLHDPVVYKACELGVHLLTDELPRVTAYS